MPSREYKVLIDLFQRLLNNANQINSKENGIYEDDESSVLLQRFLKLAKSFIATSENEQEKEKIQQLLKAGQKIEKGAIITRESFTALRLARRAA